MGWRNGHGTGYVGDSAIFDADTVEHNGTLMAILMINPIDHQFLELS